MARARRSCPAGEVFHVVNRAVARLTIFEKPKDYAAFMRVVAETWEIVPLPILCHGDHAESLASCCPP
jgi:putative transposase